MPVVPIEPIGLFAPNVGLAAERPANEDEGAAGAATAPKECGARLPNDEDGATLPKDDEVESEVDAAGAVPKEDNVAGAGARPKDEKPPDEVDDGLPNDDDGLPNDDGWLANDDEDLPEDDVA